MPTFDIDTLSISTVQFARGIHQGTEDIIYAWKVVSQTTTLPQDFAVAARDVIAAAEDLFSYVDEKNLSDVGLLNMPNAFGEGVAVRLAELEDALSKVPDFEEREDAFGECSFRGRPEAVDAAMVVSVDSLHDMKADVSALNAAQERKLSRKYTHSNDERGV